MLDKMSDTSRIVDRLLKKGFVKKTICKADKRLVDVNITTQGLQLLQEMDVYVNKMDNILGRLTDEETNILNNILDKARGSVD